MKESGSVTRLKAMGSTRTWMEPSTLATGKKTNNMDKERKPGLTELCMKGSTT